MWWKKKKQTTNLKEIKIYQKIHHHRYMTCAAGHFGFVRFTSATPLIAVHSYLKLTAGKLIFLTSWSW